MVHTPIDILLVQYVYIVTACIHYDVEIIKPINKYMGNIASYYMERMNIIDMTEALKYKGKWEK